MTTATSQPNAKSEFPVVRLESRENLEALIPDDIILVNGRKVMVMECNLTNKTIAALYPGVCGYCPIRDVHAIDSSLYEFDKLVINSDGSLSGKPIRQFMNTYWSKERETKMKERGLI